MPHEIRGRDRHVPHRIRAARSAHGPNVSKTVPSIRSSALRQDHRRARRQALHAPTRRGDHSIACVMIGTPVRPGGSGTSLRGCSSLGVTLQHSSREHASFVAPARREWRAERPGCGGVPSPRATPQCLLGHRSPCLHLRPRGTLSRAGSAVLAPLEVLFGREAGDHLRAGPLACVRDGVRRRACGRCGARRAGVRARARRARTRVTW